MPHNLYRHSGWCRVGACATTEPARRSAIRFNTSIAFVALAIACFVNRRDPGAAALVYYGKTG